MPPPLTASGYIKKDVYESVDQAMLTQDLERSCCLVVELACTANEGGALIAFLVDTYARWYVSSNLWTVRRLAQLLASLDNRSPAKMRALPHDPQARRDLCEAVLLIATQRRRTQPRCWLRASPDGKKTGEDAVRRLPAALDMRDHDRAVALVGEVLEDDRKDALIPDLPEYRPLSKVPGATKARPDLAWLAWRVLQARAEGGKNDTTGVCEMVGHLLDLYSRRYNQTRREARGNLLCYAALAVARGRVKDSPSSATHEALLGQAHACIDAVYEEVLGPDPEAERVRYLQYVDTTFDDALRCELADERRDKDQDTMSVKRVIVVRDRNVSPAAAASVS